ncbi:hypothetical protein PG999_008491 [Apiospora kogelbergensis]|uniref:Uncharacterized protein n=1 Tax=Apiospora kogelbergensis TaxID=1337665 RepID=A0AAW0QGK2_9PEZI
MPTPPDLPLFRVTRMSVLMASLAPTPPPESSARRWNSTRNEPANSCAPGDQPLSVEARVFATSRTVGPPGSGSESQSQAWTALIGITGNILWLHLTCGGSNVLCYEVAPPPQYDNDSILTAARTQ